MTYEVQRLVENLGNRLKRSVAVDDPALRLLAYNAHVGEVDSARSASILTRRVPQPLVEHIYACGAGTTTGLFTVPARAELGLDVARIGIPVHHRESLLGFVWLLESDGPVTGDQAETLREAAETIAVMLHREFLLGELGRGRERELARDLLSNQADVRAQAADQLIAEDLFAPGPGAALVITLDRGGAALTEADRLALAAGAEFGRSHRSQRQALALKRPDHAVLLLGESASSGRRSPQELGYTIRDRVLAEAAEGAGCWIGLGRSRRQLADFYGSYAEARRAAKVARVVRVLGPVVHHNELGVYGLLAELPTQRLTENLHPGVQRLLDRHTAGDNALLLTIETFLDNAGEVKRTSDQLHIHRTTLYYRLKRVEEITGLDLSTGDDRLALQLAFKIARLLEPADDGQPADLES